MHDEPTQEEYDDAVIEDTTRCDNCEAFFVLGGQDGLPCVVSCWKLTAREL